MKSIVFCADGTWNGPGQDENHDRGGNATNVFKLFLNLDGDLEQGTLRSADEQERFLVDADGTVRQAAKYLHGVGDSDNVLVRLLGGAGGAGLVTRIVRGYTFISRNYVAGDAIFIIGFSRGAYTARALAGLIAARGLLDATRLDLATDKTKAYRLGSAEWFTYRRSALREKGNRRLLDKFQEVIVDLPGFLSAPSTAPRITDVPIDTVAVWDTVGSLGIPEYNLRTDSQLDAFQFADTALSPSIAHGIHAVAIDERRGNFTPTLWTGERAVQVLFPGAHSDVGGGYTTNGDESGLSDGSLVWMTSKLAAGGVKFSATPTVVPKPDPCGPSHKPWTEPPWNLLPDAARNLPAGLTVHSSVRERLRCGNRLAPAGQPPYGPDNLREDYLDGGTLKAAVLIEGDA